MKNYSTVSELGLSNLQINIDKAEENLRILKTKRDNYIQLNNEISFSKINACFEKLKLDAVVQTIYLNGETIEQLNQNDLKISLRVTPLEGCNLKPVSHKGYDRRGVGKNNDSLIKKAESIQKKIKDLTGLDSLINEYGMEFPGRYERKTEWSFSIDLYIPNSNKI